MDQITLDPAAVTFISRLPIFDADFSVFAYDLVSACGTEQAITATDPDKTCARLIANGSLLFDWEVLTAHKRALVSVTREVLLNRSVRLLSSQETIVQLPLTIELDSEVIAACEELHDAGYGLAIDGLAQRGEWNEILQPRDVVKVNLADAGNEQAQVLTDRYRNCNARLIATRVETQETLRQAMQLGFGLFQGFFFTQPVIVSAKQIPSSKIQLLQILRELHHPDVNIEKIEQAIRTDVGLCYKLLRYINSVSHGIRHEIKTIRRALVQLGEREIKRWISLCIVSMTAEDRPPETILLTLVRARFCESIAKVFGLQRDAGDLFLMGMLSMIDTLLGRPLPELLDPLPVNPEIKEALIAGTGRFHPVYQMSRAMERGEWAGMEGRLAPVHHQEVAGAYLDSLKWGSTLLDAA